MPVFKVRVSRKCVYRVEVADEDQAFIAAFHAHDAEGGQALAEIISLKTKGEETKYALTSPFMTETETKGEYAIPPAPAGKKLVKGDDGVYRWTDAAAQVPRDEAVDNVCAACKHRWSMPRNPRCCPKCKSPYWDGRLPMFRTA